MVKTKLEYELNYQVGGVHVERGGETQAKGNEGRKQGDREGVGKLGKNTGNRADVWGVEGKSGWGGAQEHQEHGRETQRWEQRQDNSDTSWGENLQNKTGNNWTKNQTITKKCTWKSSK